MAQDFNIVPGADAKKTPKRVAFIKNTTRARVTQSDTEMVMTVPHLVVRELIAFEVMVVVLSIISLLFNAPLEWIANPQHTPNPAKAPWYFLGLQELLHYFPPIVAGVILPTLVVLALIAIPYFRVNQKQDGIWKEHRQKTMTTVIVVVGLMTVLLAVFHVYAMLVPTVIMTALLLVPYFSHRTDGWIGWLASRPVQWWVMTWFVVIVFVLTAIGTLFRGPEWSWTWPWKEIY